VDLGFETIGNATLVVHDGGPLLVTDPWLGGSAYFGSWGLAYDIPAEQAAAIAEAPWVWFSHGHPDHLHPGSLPSLTGRRILLADHVGGRIVSDLRRGGLNVTVLRDNVWYPLSDRVRVMSVADYNQDSVLLVDVGGRLVANLNDSTEKGWGSLLRRVIRGYDVSFLLRLSGYGDADMINFFDEDGQRAASGPELRKAAGYKVGAQVARMADTFGARYFVPFSSFHRYQRSDSAWANGCTTALDDFGDGFDSKRSELLPAFIRYDCVGDSVQALDPEPAAAALEDPETFGDDWTDELTADEARQVSEYFSSVEHLHEVLEFVNLRIGGRDNVVPFRGATGQGITFEVPRTSLLTAVRWNIFDDLLIGNFMRTTLHGRWPASKLSVDVTPYVAKYADNGQARTQAELRAYFDEYRRRLGPARYFRHVLERHAKQMVQSRWAANSSGLELASRTYQRIASRT
jgi:hypothetical protein